MCIEMKSTKLNTNHKIWVGHIRINSLLYTRTFGFVSVYHWCCYHNRRLVPCCWHRLPNNLISSRVGHLEFQMGLFSSTFCFSFLKLWTLNSSNKYEIWNLMIRETNIKTLIIQSFLTAMTTLTQFFTLQHVHYGHIIQSY